MTECERLIQEGSVPADFLNPETRECEVPTEIKKLWALQIDMLQQVRKICERHGLTFFAAYGTALGAVRHHGFIPWDDDVDIALKRADYNKFVKYAQKELKEPYFLQLPSTDEYYFRPYASLRNSNATCIAKGDGALKCNNGAIIHIFPLDGYTESKELRRFIKIERFKNIVAVNSYHYRGRKNHVVIRHLLKLITPLVIRGGLKKHFLRHEAACTKISSKEHEMLGIQYAHFGSDISKSMYKKELFDSVVWVPFEYAQIPIPAGYDEFLRRTYGDYMQLPKPEDRIYKHTWEMDPDTPYKEYCSKKYGVKY